MIGPERLPRCGSIDDTLGSCSGLFNIIGTYSVFSNRSMISVKHQILNDFIIRIIKKFLDDERTDFQL